jgi:GNAT superfamily N-acetyltransferase
VLHLWRTRQQVFTNYKKYFLPETRGLGIGSAMMTKCLETAKDFGFKQCYLETMPFMLDAKLYRKVGFENINALWEAPVIHPVRMDAEKFVE